MAKEKSGGDKDNGSFMDKMLGTLTKKIVAVTALLAAITGLITSFQKGADIMDSFRDTDVHFEFVLDASSYMTAPAEAPRGGEESGPSKWTVAVRGITSTLAILEGKPTKVAVRRFGGDCGSERMASRRLADFARDNSTPVLDALGNTRACGDPDLAMGLSGAVDDLREAGRRGQDSLQIRVVTAGQFTNTESMALDVVKQELSNLGIKPKFRFIGIGVGEQELVQLDAIAASYGGVAIPVDNAADFMRAADPNESESALLQQLLLKRQAKQLYSKQKDAEALELFQKLANAGDADGWLYMGNIYYDPASREQSMEKAKINYRKAAVAGNMEAMFSLAAIAFEEGNESDGMKLLQEAADAGHALAREELNKRNVAGK